MGKQILQMLLERGHEDLPALSGQDAGQVFHMFLQMIEDVRDHRSCVVFHRKVVSFLFSQVFGKNMLEYIRAERCQQIVFRLEMRIKGRPADIRPVDDILYRDPGIGLLLEEIGKRVKNGFPCLSLPAVHGFPPEQFSESVLYRMIWTI